MNQVADHANDCKVCESGTYFDADKGTVCKDCPAGTVRVFMKAMMAMGNHGIQCIVADATTIVACESGECYVK